MNEPIANINIYRLDIYRLLTMLLADKQVTQDKEFTTLGKEFTDGEVNRLLILIATISRQLLEDVYGDETIAKRIKNLEKQKCGEYWKDINNKQELGFKRACNFIIHAKDITPYKLPEKEKKKDVKRNYVKYFEKFITIKDKRATAELDFSSFMKICIMLSNEVIKGDFYANR